jgi:hypothetical protein
MSGRNPEAENLRRSAIVAPAARPTAQPAMIALEWNIGIDTYTVSPVPSPNRPASIRPGTAIFPWVHLTALGSPLVPDVKISMSRSSGVAGAASSGACAGSSSPSSGSTGTSIAGSSAA